MVSRMLVSNTTLIINNISFVYVPDSFKYTEGRGEFLMQAGTGGGSQVVTMFSQDVKNAISSVKFDLFPDVATLEAAKDWKNRLNANVLTWVQLVGGEEFTRTMQNAALCNDPEIELSSSGKFSVEFKGDRAI